MTIPEQQVRYVYDGPYDIGDIAPIPFDYMETSHVKAARNEEILEFNVDYTVLGQNLTLRTNILATDKLVVFRDTPLDNDAEFPQEADFDSAKINDSIDKLTMQNQEQEEELDRCIKFPIDSSEDLKDITFPTPDANKCIKWNEDGTALVNSKYDPDALADLILDAGGNADAAAKIAVEAAKDALESAERAEAAADRAEAAADRADSYSKEEINNFLSTKQDKLTAGDYIKIQGNVISATPEDMVHTYEPEEWESLPQETKNSIKVAFIYE